MAVGRALKAGLIYFLIVFAIGFVLGAARVLWVAPHLGVTMAVSLEVPLMLAASWIVCKAILARRSPGRGMSARLLMGASAFLFLQVAELGLSVALGRTPTQHFAGYVTGAGVIGLAAQLGFGVMPVLLGEDLG